jgi:hypothetical protein
MTVHAIASRRPSGRKRRARAVQIALVDVRLGLLSEGGKLRRTLTVPRDLLAQLYELVGLLIQALGNVLVAGGAQWSDLHALCARGHRQKLFELIRSGF